MDGNGITFRMGQSARFVKKALLRLELDGRCPMSDDLEVSVELNGRLLPPPVLAPATADWLAAELDFAVPPDCLQPGVNCVRILKAVAEYQQVIDGLRLDVE